MAKQQNSNDSEKTWTVETLRKALEKPSMGIPLSYLLTAKVIWRHLPLEFLPLIPNLEGVTWAPLQPIMTPQPLATWKDPWGLATGKRTLEVCITSRELDCEFTLDTGSDPVPFSNLQNALHYLTV